MNILGTVSNAKLWRSVGVLVECVLQPVDYTIFTCSPSHSL